MKKIKEPLIVTAIAVMTTPGAEVQAVPSSPTQDPLHSITCR